VEPSTLRKKILYKSLIPAVERKTLKPKKVYFFKNKTQRFKEEKSSTKRFQQLIEKTLNQNFSFWFRKRSG